MITQVLHELLVRPTRSIGGLYPDVVVEESHEDTLQITEHPVETGAPVSDHVIRLPAVVTLRAGVSNSSLQSLGVNPAQEFYEKLLELQAAAEPFDIVTGKRLYKNMLLESLTVNTGADTEQILSFSAQCREVIMVSIRVVTLPPSRVQKNPAKTGSAVDKGQKQPQKRQSIAKATASEF